MIYSPPEAFSDSARKEAEEFFNSPKVKEAQEKFLKTFKEEFKKHQAAKWAAELKRIREGDPVGDAKAHREIYD